MVRVKRLLDIDEDVWNLLKSYAGGKGININEAAEFIISEYLSKLKEALKNV